MMKKILCNIGHRGAFLILLGLSFIFYGLTIRYLPFHNIPSNLILTIHQWTWVWMITGAFLVGRAIGRKDKIAFGIAAFISAWWSARWLWLWLFDNAAHAWAISALWFVITCLIGLVSTWPEFSCRKLKNERDRE